MIHCGTVGMRADGIHSLLHCISGHKNLNGGKSSLGILIVTFALIFACDLTFWKAKNVTLKICKGVWISGDRKRQSGN